MEQVKRWMEKIDAMRRDLERVGEMLVVGR